MAKKKPDDWIQDGQDLMCAAIEPLHDAIPMMAKQAREQFWTGLIISAVTFCRASIGREMTELICKSALELQKELPDPADNS